ncbi:outer membrane protein assembly factor BamE [Falsiroseomonas oryziterrae]|uniref:outer membrane protein assembly factor BamE n=1 Tax=Falsiroseomonas oryziterrae TaxID=2911368 RepID=UPI001EFFD955|nr:outer membrane protein assembly factor BamE [Roseomonas sp. NPKOSM-4]
MERHTQMVNAPLVSPPARPVFRLALGLAGLLGLGGCSYLPAAPSLPGASLFSSPAQVRGHMVDDEDLRQITVGVSSRDDVQTVLGSPTATGTFEDREWFYIGSITRQRPGMTLAVEDQRTVVVRFNDAGIVQEVRKLGPEDARQVRVVQRVTPTPGNERTLLQQLFGNIGRVGPGLGGSQPGGPTGGAPAPTGRQ